MIQTLFLEFVEKYFRKFVGKITEKFNDKSKEPELLHKTMLREEYSADMTWEAEGIDHNVIAADVVSMDSTLPLKRRDTLRRAGGKLPKIGIKFKLGEKQISDINVMIARGTEESTIAAKIFNDVEKSIKGVDVRTEIMFLQAFSTGFCLVESDENDGTGIRVNYGYKEENTMHALVAAWGESTATPIDDIRQLFDKADEDGNNIGYIYLSKKRLDNIRNSDQGKTLVAGYQNQLYTDVANLKVPSRKTMLEALNDEFDAVFEVVGASYKIQGVNGKFSYVKPFDEDNIIATPDKVVGRLVYGTLVEETKPVAGVIYQKSGSHILVSKFSKNDPFAEFTTAQAICLPVIDGVEGIYVLHTDSTGSSLSLSPSTMNFAVGAGSKTADIHYDGSMGDLTISSNQNYATATRKGGKLTVKMTANASGSQRTATITVSDGTESATISLTQAAS